MGNLFNPAIIIAYFVYVLTQTKTLKLVLDSNENHYNMQYLMMHLSDIIGVNVSKIAYESVLRVDSSAMNLGRLHQQNIWENKVCVSIMQYMCSYSQACELFLYIMFHSMPMNWNWENYRRKTVGFNGSFLLYVSIFVHFHVI